MIRVRARTQRRHGLDKLHRNVLAAMNAALEAADPPKIIRKHLRLDRQILHADRLQFRLRDYRRIFVIGGGKASGLMAEAIERLLGRWITRGLVIIPDYQRPKPRGSRIRYHLATHPIPTRKGMAAVLAMLDLVKTVSRDDLVIVLLSGGGSALITLPMKGVTLNDEAKVTSLLLKSGASIEEINTVRKHLSQVKGGRLARRLFPATVLTLIISDVVGDTIEAIASGPTAPDPTTYKDAEQVLKKHHLWSKVPKGVRSAILNGLSGSLPETPKRIDKSFKRVHNLIVGSNRASRLAAGEAMRKVGYETQVLSIQITGEARKAGRMLGSIAKDIQENGQPLARPAGLVTGGETTVTVRGKGKGGRNQELALAAAERISGSHGIVVGSFATDGVEVQTDAAGALVDGTTVTRGLMLGMDPETYLRNNDSYHYFSKLKDLIITGPTGTNVNDIIIIAVDRR
jgi:glycerate 2-kinase